MHPDPDIHMKKSEKKKKKEDPARTHHLDHLIKENCRQREPNLAFRSSENNQNREMRRENAQIHRNRSRSSPKTATMHEKCNPSIN